MAEPKEFLNDDMGFQKWRRENPEGFILHFRTKKKTSLHNARCFHFGKPEANPAEEGWTLTEKRKACFHDREKLSKLADREGAEFKECGHCFRKRD